jgi:hypothetical protein
VRDSARRGRFWGLAVLVLAWWVSIGTVVVATLPASVASAPRREFVVAPGQTARIEQPGMTYWPIPADRAAFDEIRRGYQEGDEDAIERASRATTWLKVSHGEAVRVLAVDGEAVQVEMLDGASAGHRGWLLKRHLSESRRF